MWNSKSITSEADSAAADAGVENVLYVSIVGVDAIPLSYYEHKLAAERAVETSDVPGSGHRDGDVGAVAD